MNEWITHSSKLDTISKNQYWKRRAGQAYKISDVKIIQKKLFLKIPNLLHQNQIGKLEYILKEQRTTPKNDIADF